MISYVITFLLMLSIINHLQTTRRATRRQRGLETAQEAICRTPTLLWYTKFGPIMHVFHLSTFFKWLFVPILSCILRNEIDISTEKFHASPPCKHSTVAIMLHGHNTTELHTQKLLPVHHSSQPELSDSIIVR